MSTRGLVGVSCNNRKKLSYNHFDSYPSVTGKKVVRDIKKLITQFPHEELREMFFNIRQFNWDARVRDEHREYFGDYESQDYYWLLNDMQGELYEHMLQEIMLDSNSFFQNNLDCAWTYIMNLDNKTLEVYCSSDYENDMRCEISFDEIKETEEEEIMDLFKKHLPKKF